VEEILKKALLKVKEAEVYGEDFKNTTVSFQSNRLKSIDTSLGQGIGLRVIKNGKIGFSSITDQKDLKFLVTSALKTTSLGQSAFFKFPAISQIPRIKCFDEIIPSISVEQMIEEGRKVIQAILKEFPSFQCEVEIDKTTAKTSILNSSGLNFNYKKSFYAFSIHAFLAQEGDFLGIGEGESGCKYQDWSNLITQRIIEKIRLAQKKTIISTGSYPIIFTAKAMPVIFSLLKRAINGKLVQKKISPLSSKLNKLIISPLVNIVDDATLPYGKASSPIDGEGVPSRQNPIIEEGVLKNFIYDLQTAGLMKTQTTANATRDYDTLPSPSTTNFIVSPGHFSLKEMIKDVKEGLIIDQVIGAGQSNVLMGEFSVNCDLGFKIEKGEIKGRVKNAMVTGNIYELLNNILGIGKETQFVGSTCTPAFYFAQVNVAS